VVKHREIVYAYGVEQGLVGILYSINVDVTTTANWRYLQGIREQSKRRLAVLTMVLIAMGPWDQCRLMMLFAPSLLGSSTKPYMIFSVHLFFIIKTSL
jgi:hypothetical protein